MKDREEMKYDKIATYFRLNLAVVIVVIISGMFFDGLMWIVPLLQGDLINSFAQGQSFEAVALCATYFLGVVLFIQLNRLVKRNYVREFANRAKLQMRERAFSNLLMTDRAQLNTQSKGQVATIILSDIEDTVEGMRKVTTEIFDSIVLLIGYIISMFVLDWRITLCVLPFFVVSALSAELLKKKIYHSTANYKREYSKYKSHTLSLINNDIFLRGTGAVSRYQRQYEETVKNLENSSVKSLIYKNAFAPLYSVIAIIGIVFVIVLGAGKVQDGVWDIGEFSAYIATFMLVATKISKVGKVFNAYTSARVSWVRCKGNLAKKSVEYKTITVPAKLEISNLTFGFDDNFKVQDIDIDALEGEWIGIAGVVHSGKSTVGAVMSGLYDYEGTVKLCGVELKDIKEVCVPNFISYMSSKPELFNDTIENNIALGRSGNIDDALIGADLTRDGISKESLISRNTTNLSGGQQKRLEIARAIFSPSKLIVLDDPFNAVDVEMAKEILSELRERTQKSILVIVSCNKEILSMCDKVLFLSKAKAQYDTYPHLLNKSEEFGKLMEGDIK